MDLKYKHRIIILFYSTSLVVHFFNVSASENSQLCVPCKPGWYHFGEKCYKILGLNKPLNWENSREKCSLEGGHLASIHSNELQEFLTVFLIMPSQKGVWIGLHDRIRDARFSWDDGSKFDYTNWDAHRPFSTQRGIDNKFDCVEMRYDGHMKSRGVGTWADQQCDFLPRPYLCQVNKSVDTNSSDPRFCSSEDGGGFKYFNSCYHIVEEEKSWEDAESYCEEKFEGNLVTILNWRSEMFINHIHKLFLPKDIWIGLKLKNDGTTKTWASGGNVTYSNWSKNPLYFGNGSCVLKSYRNEWDSWEFSPCFNKFPFICEKKIAPLPQRTSSDDWKCPNSLEKNSLEKNSSEKNLSEEGLDPEGDPCFYTETEKSQNLLEARDECRRIGGISAGTVVGIVFCTLLTVLLIGVIVYFSRIIWKRSSIKSENNGFSTSASGFVHHASKDVIWRPLR